MDRNEEWTKIMYKGYVLYWRHTDMPLFLLLLVIFFSLTFPFRL